MDHIGGKHFETSSKTGENFEVVMDIAKDNPRLILRNGKSTVKLKMHTYVLHTLLVLKPYDIIQKKSY